MRKLLSGGLLLLLAGCSSSDHRNSNELIDRGTYQIDTHYPSVAKMSGYGFSPSLHCSR